MNVRIETERLLIRAIEEYNAEGIFELDSDPDVHEFLGKKPIKTIKEAEEIIESIRNQYVAFGIGALLLLTKKPKILWGGQV